MTSRDPNSNPSAPPVPAEPQPSSDPIADAVRETFRTGGPVTAAEPVDELQANIERLLANQRTPDTIEVPRRAWRRLIIMLVLVVVFAAATVAFAAVRLVHDSSLPTVRPLAVHAVAATVDPQGMTDAQLAEAIAADCTPGACLLAPTTGNVGTRWVPWVCAQVAQLGTPPGDAAWQAAWTKIGPLVVATGRCSEPSTSQLARELAALPGASGRPMDPASLDDLLEHACPEGGSRTHTTYSAAVLRLVVASGRCSR